MTKENILFSKVAELKLEWLKPEDKAFVKEAIENKLLQDVLIHNVFINDKSIYNISENLYALKVKDKFKVNFSFSEHFLIIIDIEAPQFYFNDKQTEEIINQYKITNPKIGNILLENKDVEESDFSSLNKILPKKYRKEINEELLETKYISEKEGNSNLVLRIILFFTLILIAWNLLASRQKEKVSEFEDIK